jgi:hypothetical protein
MKNKIVIWGTNEADEKVLIALELQPEASRVMLYTFTEEMASEEFVSKMMSEWRDGKEVEFPQGHTAAERELSVTESLLPDGLKVGQGGDLIQRAQTEWHFVVLSTKLHQVYKQELEEFKEKVAQLGTYDNKLWDGLKSFWDKVQRQSSERTLFREHANHLRDNINLLFEDLKVMRKKVQGEFMEASAGVASDFNKALDDIEARIAAGGSKLGSVFEELKQMQRRYREARMSNEHRNQIWDRLDKAFKKAKERKFGPEANAGSVVDHHERRLSGLAEALKRMEDSVRRDDEELEFQGKKVDRSEGQLEAQIRMAKIKMIEERVVSKRAKIEDMRRTIQDIERQANAAKNKEAKRAEKLAEKDKIAAAKETVKSEIAAEIKTKAQDAPPEKEDSLFEAAATLLGDVLVDAIDTAKAVASVVADKAEEAFDKASDKAEEAFGKATEKGEETLGKAKVVASMIADEAEAAMDKAAHKGEGALEKAKVLMNKMAEKAGEALEQVEEAIDKAGDQGEGAMGKAKAVANLMADKASEVLEKAEEAIEAYKAKKGAEETAAATEKEGIIIEDIVHKSAATLESIADTAAEKEGIIIEDIVHKSAATLESTADTAAEKDGIIIEDIVHKSVAEASSATGDAAEDVAVPKKTTKKKDA